MSKEQWGNGYWKGVQDAETHSVKSNIDVLPEVTEKILRFFGQANKLKGHDRSLVPMRAVRTYLMVCGCDPDLWKKVHDYIMNMNPLGCYITGSWSDEPLDDDIVLSNVVL